MFENISGWLPQSIKTKIKRLLFGLNYVSSRILPRQQAQLRGLYYKGKKNFIRRYLSYGPDELISRLRSLGIRSGETLLVHSSYKQFSGFQGSLDGLIETLLRTLGPDGNLMMVSLPYNTYTYEYLRQLKLFDVRKTPSRMGLVSEAFRRRKQVLRSLHPTHPVLAYGPKAEWIVSGHEKASSPCGLGTPFEKLALLQGKILFLDASFFTNTFYHYLEEIIKDDLSFPLYFEEPFEVSVIDQEGHQAVVRAFAFSLEAIQRRRPEVLKVELEKRGWLKKAKIGNSRMLLIETSQTITCVKEMAKQGIYFYTHV